jgi:3-oxoacyl-[acyl-carrier protein] reductase
MTKELAGKVAFVTGSGRGLGFAMPDRLAEVAADVAIHDIDWRALAKCGEAADFDVVATRIARHGGKVTAAAGNLGDRDAVARMKTEIEP